MDKAKHRRKYGSNSKHKFQTGRSTAKQQRIPLPPKFSLDGYHGEVMAFITRFRELAIRDKQWVYADFRTLREVGPAGALLLAAELDRWRRLRDFRMHVVKSKSWDQNVCRLFDEMGLFDLLDVDNPPSFGQSDEADIKFVRFRSDNTALGDKAKQLRSAIESIAGPVPEASNLYRALTEAMSNVSNHAYPEGESYEIPILKKQWWMAGSYSQPDRRLTIMFYDQGVGIPVTLPRKHTREKINGILDKLGLKDDDGARIRAAMELHRSRTDLDNRGYGLFRDIRNYTKLVDDGRMRILSGTGEYIFRPQETDRKQREQIISHPIDIGGTLIQWEVCLPEV